jgi:RimJ/RimL family protein N-acetyltransferase
MTLLAREMTLQETELVIRYFHGASPEFLEILGVDPTRLPAPAAWRERFAREFSLPIEQRSTFFLTWLDCHAPIGFSSADKIIFGERANMHLHVIDPGRRNRGCGALCVKRSAAIYFERLGIRQLFCEPNAFNTAPNRALQRAGFKYVKTHMTVPGPTQLSSGGHALGDRTPARSGGAKSEQRDRK